MIKLHWMFALLLYLPLSAQAQSDSPEELHKRLLQTGQDTNRVKLLLQLGNYYIFKPEELKVDLDLALTLIQEAKALSETLQNAKWKEESLWMLSFCHFERREVADGRDAFMQVIEQYKKGGNKAREASAWLRMGRTMNRNTNTYDECVSYLQQAITLYRQLGEKEAPIEALKDIADIHLNQGKLVESEHELLEVIELYKQIGYRNLHYTYDLLVAVSTLKGNLDRALLFGFEMIKSMEATGDSASAATFYYRMGRVYSQLQQAEKSVEWYKKSYTKRKGEDYGLCMSIALILVDIGKTNEALAFVNNVERESPPVLIIDKLFILSAKGSCYNALKKYDLAEKYFLEMVQLERQMQKGNYYTYLANFTLGGFYVSRRRYQDAEKFLKNILDLPGGIVSAKDLKDTHLLLFKVDSAAGNYMDAIRHYQMHKRLNDSIFTETKIRQIQELDIKYATEKKETELKTLQNEKSLQQSALREANLAKNITFASGALLLVILGLLYNRYRLKQRSNRQLELQQIEINQTNLSLQNLVNEKELLLREIHHRVKNNLQIVMSLLNSQSDYLQNDAALTAIRDSQQRIHSISLIHKKLYQSNNIARINMPVYIQELVDYLQDSYGTGQAVRFDLKIDPIDLDVTQAVPVGLILNEAISNAVKYAFPDKRAGVVSISMEHGEADQYKLSIADNGTGLPPGFDPRKSASLGMSLMRGLSKQLHGSFDLKNDGGLTVAVTFEKEYIANARSMAA